MHESDRLLALRGRADHLVIIDYRKPLPLCNCLQDFLDEGVDMDWVLRYSDLRREVQMQACELLLLVEDLKKSNNPWSKHSRVASEVAERRSSPRNVTSLVSSV